ncbi:helix-turn-helix domain-containing protein [Hydrogenovibrio marinus]|uniref:Helix-turn-helix domain-containing protein n=1 Tax=Hydrogenovibrio marinus TaxID=28885 RepID=A0A066ZRT7_HYDMR|nr:helix-turn-helix domain-containing protein [Hydrogenovibrio marinus]KDN96528.1 hypothetical protein EI16_09725 [Hydrogenovibrio marinus]BBN60267.1 hypothetical protein HVMH_1861 [Hydrogenovibrio marinus]
MAFDGFLTSKEAAEFLGCAEITLRAARVSGVLFGLPAPAFKKLGRRVYYSIEELEAWVLQIKNLPDHVNTLTV